MNMFIRTIKLLAISFSAVAVLSACGGAPDGSGTSADGSGGNLGNQSVFLGNGLGDDFTVGEVSSSNTSLAAGETVTLSVQMVDGNNAAYVDSGVTIEFSSNCEAAGIADFSDSRVFTSTGFATTLYTANGCSGDDVIIARATDSGFFDRDENGFLIFDNVVLIAEVSLNIAQDTVVDLRFIPDTFAARDSGVTGSVVIPDFQDTLTLPGAGGSQTSEVSFRVIGAQGASVIGETVNFSVSNPAGGVAIVEGRESDVSDNNGIVSTVVRSGTVSTTFSVVATHPPTSVSSLSDSIVVSSGAAAANRFNIAADATRDDEDGDGDMNTGELFVENGSNTVGTEVTISVLASDAFGNDIPDGNQVFFASPINGNVGSSCTISGGQCSVTWISEGGVPFNFRTYVIAYTDGAEAFEDSNANAVYEGNAVDNFNVATMGFGRALY